MVNDKPTPNVVDEAKQKEIEQLNNAVMRDWPNPPKIADINQDVTHARSFTSLHMERIQRYREARENKYKGKANTDKHARVKSSFSPKIVRRQNEWRYSSLSEPFLSQPELFKIRPKSHDDVNRARQNQLILNHQFEYEINRVKFIDDVVRALVDDGTVIVKTGWLYQECETFVDVPKYNLVTPDPAQAQELSLVIAELQTNPDFINQLDEGMVSAIEHLRDKGELLYPVQDGFTKERQTKVLKDRPEVIVCDPANVIIDPSCDGDIEKANFIAYEFETSKTELLSSGIDYKNLDKVNFKSGNGSAASYMSELDEEAKTFQFSDEARSKIRAYEYWGYLDIIGNGTVTPVVITFIDNIIIRAEVNPFNHSSLPFDVESLMPVRKNLYGEADAELIEDDQAIIGSLSRSMIDLVAKSAGGQTAFAKGHLDPVNMVKYRKGMDYEANSNDLSRGIMQHQFPELSSSVLNLYQLHNNNVDSNSGTKAFSGGLSGDSLGSSVGGITSALSAAQKRELGILRRATRLVTSVGKKVVAMNSQYLTEDYVVRLTNNEFEAVATDDLEGKFDINLTISSVEADNKRVADLSFLLQTGGASLPFEVTQMIWAEITYLQKSYDLSKRIEEFVPQPDPVEAKLKELEMAKIEAEITEIRAEAMERQAKAQKAMADAQKALADANKAQSEADMLDLTHVEQAEGVTQERELQKLQAQGVANIALEETKQRSKQNKVES